jgi:hypothetical protein
MFRLLQATPLSSTPSEEPRLADARLARGEHGLLLETTGLPISVRRRLSQEILVPRATRFLLEDDDVLWGPGGGLAVRSEPEHRSEHLEGRAVEDWSHAAHFGVLADHLLDHGDPLGERIAAQLGRRTNTPVAPHTWIGTDWHHGLLRRISVSRPEWTAAVPWRQALLEVLASRAARFLDEVAIDLPRLEPDSDLPRLARELFALPWPRWVSRLHFGLVAAPPMVVPPAELRERLPRLGHGPLFDSAEHGRLLVESAADTLELEGLDAGAIELREGLRIRVFPRKVLLERPSWPRYDSWPSWDFAFHDGRWFLTWRHGAPRSDDVRINGMEFFNAALVPGDRVEVLEQLVLRFEAGERVARRG